MATSPTSGPGGGGSAYTAPVTREQLFGSNVVINNGAAASLTWDFDSGPDVVLDTANLGVPVVLAAGVYAVTVEIAVNTAITVGNVYLAALRLDSLGDAPTVTGSSPPAAAGDQVPQLTLGLTYYIPLGGGIRVQVTNLDVAARTFKLNNAIVQRIS